MLPVKNVLGSTKDVPGSIYSSSSTSNCSLWLFVTNWVIKILHIKPGKAWYWYSYPAGEPSMSPRFPRGSSLWKFPLNSPAEIWGKFGGNFYVAVSASFPCRIPGDITTWKFPSFFPQNFKMQYSDIGRVPVMWKYPSDELMTFFVELKCLRFGETSLSFQPRLENSSPRGFTFHLE